MRSAALLAVTAVLAGTAVAGATAASAAPATTGTAQVPTAQAPTGLRVAGQSGNALVGQPRPALSWVVHDSGRGQAQTAYEITLIDRPTDQGGGNRLWDSGRVYSAASTGVAYRGPKLAAGHTYDWRVRTWNRQQQASPWSTAQRIDVGPLAVTDWHASWLSAADGSLLRRDFTLDQRVTRARLYLTAQGLAEPHLNGAPVAPDDVLDSSVTDYAKRVLYRSYDVTDRLAKGANTLAVMLGKGQFAGTPTFLAQLEITLADGTHQVIGSDDHWVRADGPVTRDDFYYGESWDQRKLPAGWDGAAFDDSGWSGVPVAAPVSQPASLAVGHGVTALDETACCGWSRAALVDGIDRSVDGSEGYHSGIESDADHTKWVQVDLGADRPIAGITLYPTDPTNDTDGNFPGEGFPVRYEVQASDDPTFADATTVVDHTDADQPNPGNDPVALPADVTARYVRVTATKLYCRNGGCNFRLAELGVYDAHPATTWGLTAVEPDPSPATRIVSHVAPVRTSTPADGVTGYDFGQNRVGQLSLTADAPAGTKVSVVKGELLDEHGRVTTSNISFSAGDTGRQVDDYTFDGSGEQTFTPNFNYAGFRYAEVTGLPAGTTVHVVQDEIHTDVASTGSFTSSDPLLNQVQDALRQTQLNDLQTMPLDCPTREKHGWLGDAGDTDAEALANFDMQSLYDKWLADIRTSANPDGSVPSVAPTNGGTGWVTDPAWGTAFPQVVWDSYQQYGDRTVLNDNYAAVKKWVDYLATISDGDGIVTNSPGAWGDDWLATVSTPHVYFQTLFSLLDARLLAQMARALGNSADARTYTARAAHVEAGFTAKYFDAGTDVYQPNTQLAYAMPLALHIVPAGHTKGVLAHLVSDIAAHGDHLTTGFVGTTYVYQALGAYGRNDVALAVSQRTDFPSFGYMLANGPGTIWEKWTNSSQPDGTSSKDHIGLAGSIGQWYYQQLAGIQPGTAGWRTFTLAPSVAGDLTHVSATQQTVRGPVTSAWQLGDDGTLTYHAVVPVGATATIDLPLPGGAASTVTEGGRTILAAGQPADSDPGLTVGQATASGLHLTAGSGDYTFTVQRPAKARTTLAISAGSPTVAISPGTTGNVPVSVDARSTAAGTATLGAQVPAGWTVSATPASVPLAAARTHTLATVHLTPPASTRGTFTIPLTVTGGGRTATTSVTVQVYRTTVLYDFESGTQGWQAGANVTGVDTAASTANRPGTPYDGQAVLQASMSSPNASDWRTVSVTPDQPLDLSDATHVQLAIDGYGGVPDATYRAQVVLHSGADSRTLTTPIDADTWNLIGLDVSDWAGRSNITSIDVSYSAVGNTDGWSGAFQIDDVGWTDQ